MDITHSFTPGERVVLKEDGRYYSIYALYGSDKVSLGLHDYPDTEQDILTDVSELEKLPDEIFCGRCDAKLEALTHDLDPANFPQVLVCPACGYGRELLACPVCGTRFSEEYDGCSNPDCDYTA